MALKSSDNCVVEAIRCNDHTLVKAQGRGANYHSWLAIASIDVAAVASGASGALIPDLVRSWQSRDAQHRRTESNVQVRVLLAGGPRVRRVLGGGR
jgi:hypothetical protein